MYYEIARLRWSELIRGVPEDTGFTVAEFQPVLEPFRVAASQSPPLPEVYMLMADAWLRCRERMRASNLPALLAATPLFRRIPGISYRVALLQLREGQRVGKRVRFRASVGFAGSRAESPEMEAGASHRRIGVASHPALGIPFHRSSDGGPQPRLNRRYIGAGPAEGAFKPHAYIARWTAQRSGRERRPTIERGARRFPPHFEKFRIGGIDFEREKSCVR